MRGQVDRVTSRQLLDQDQFERRLDQLFKRQTALEARASSLGALADPAVTAPSSRTRRSPGAGDSPAAPPKTIPDQRQSGLHRAAGSRSPLRLRGATPSVSRRMARDQRRPGGALAAPAGFARPGRGAPDMVAQHARGKLRHQGQAHARRAGRAGPRPNLGTASGGPFVPLPARVSANAFDGKSPHQRGAGAKPNKLTRTMSTVPIRSRFTGEIDMTSSFGVRIDPFLGRPAMHTGIDFHGTQGDPICETVPCSDFEPADLVRRPAAS